MTPHAAIPDGEVDGGLEHINRIEAMRNRLAAGETTFTLDELKLTLAWADHLNYFRSLDMPRLTALEAECRNWQALHANEVECHARTLAENAALKAEVAEARAKAIEECAETERLRQLLFCAGVGLSLACEGGVPDTTLKQLWIDPHGLRSDIAGALGRDPLAMVPAASQGEQGR